MLESDFLVSFIERTGEDSRIGKGHLALYSALLYLFAKRGFSESIRVYSREVMPIAKISHGETYHLYMKQLSEYNYIDYTPSYNRFKASRISLITKGRT